MVGENMFKIDLNGRVNNLKLPKTKAMLPIYEGIVNSIHSIQHRDYVTGKIKVYIEREYDELDLKGVEDHRNHSNIVNVIIEDNGIGFDTTNFESFLTSDSRHKVALGGKGIGRLLWLKSFREVKIESVFSDEENEMKKRTFLFNLEGNNVHNHTLEKTNDEQITRVSLLGFKEMYSSSIPKKLETIAYRIIEHTISYFLLQDCPDIQLFDGDTQVSLIKLYNEMMKSNHKEEDVNIKGHEFKIHHVKLFTAEDTNNKLHYCANRRQVLDINLGSKISDLTGRIVDGEDNFTYSAFVTSDFFDRSVDAERTGFNVLNDVDGTLFSKSEEMSMKGIEGDLLKRIEAFLDDYLKPIRLEKQEKVNNYINTEVPQYKYLAKYDSDLYNNIQPGLSKEKLELELFKRSQIMNLKFKEEGAAILNKPKEKITNSDEYKEKRMQYLEMANDFGKSNLAQYIMHRKVILELFESGLELDRNNKYSKEEYVHNIIFPIRATSDDITFEDHNLWLIDEKLAYHSYLASDKELKSMDVLDSESRDRPDLFLINNPITVVNDEKPHSSVVIFELKRPERGAYRDSDNPIDQLRRYVKQIQNGLAKDKNGRTIKIKSNTPFYLYVLCDITQKIDDFAELSQLIPTPDEMGYFGNLKIGDTSAYIEIISFDKLLVDAKQRNRVLFDKLFNQSIEKLH